MEASLYILIAVILMIAGVIGTIAPILPGVPLCWAGLLVLKFVPFVQNDISWTTIIVLGVLALFITILDNVLPVWGTKRMGGNKKVVWGATIGLIVGFFGGPLGIIFGPFVGALAGGLLSGSQFRLATRHAFGAFLGYVGGLLLKLIAVGIIAFYFVRAIA